MKTVNNNTNDEFKCNLTDMQNYVTQENGTEPSFNNEYWDNKKIGIYVDIVSGEVLFSSLDKYDSGTGWPSFTKPINKDNIVEVIDNSLGMKRVEIRSKKANSHLGHVFNDGPEPSGVRYCMNSSSLKFIPADEMEKNGYGGYLKLFIEEPVLKPDDKPYYQFATFTAGCFWGVETILKGINGVIETTVGYTGGKTKFPSYYDVSKGNTEHAEAVMIKFDPKIISYEELLGYFWRLHDPTQLNRQGADIGSQYRSAIFYHNEEQKNIALKSKENVDKSGVFNKKAVTEITPFSIFYKAEEYHQDYHDKFGGYMCHVLREK